MFGHSFLAATVLSFLVVPSNVTPANMQAQVSGSTQSSSSQESSPKTSSERLQVNSALLRRAEPPNPAASARELETRADELRAEKAYIDALDYYRAAISQNPKSAQLYNKAGIVELLMQRFAGGRKDFERAIKADRNYSDAYNNLGVIHYLDKKYGKAIKQYEKAAQIRPEAASYYSNIGAAYFSKKDFEKANLAYLKAVELDPDIFEHTSRNGVAAQMSSPADRAHFDYVMARLYAKMGVADRSLLYLRRAMEEGYKSIQDVYKEAEFGELRKDPRFSAMMAAKPLGIPD